MDRLLAWYRVNSSVGAAVALVAANLVPLVGVLFLGWSMWTILIVYWVENGIVGFYNVLKMAAVAGIGKFGVIPFFVIHYGLFWLVHGVFVFSLPIFIGMGTTVDPSIQPVDPMAPGAALLPGDGFDVRVAASPEADLGYVLVAAIGLFVSHGVSYVFNFLRGGEARRTTPMELMFAPYRRVVILHLTILFGAFAVAFLGAQLVPLVILVTLKTIVDLGFHLREHHAVPAGATHSTA